MPNLPGEKFADFANRVAVPARHCTSSLVLAVGPLWKSPGSA